MTLTDQKKAVKILIVGGVAGGASAATRARRCNPHAEITILERGEYVSYANCGIPYHLGGEIEKREKLIVTSPDLFEKRFKISIKLHHEALNIDRISKSVSGICHSTGDKFVFPYDKLILSPGASLRPFPLTHSHLSNFFTLWNLPDMDAILRHIETSNIKRAAVIGAGFVGLEVVEQLRHRGIDVSLIELANQVLPPIDPELSRFVEEQLTNNQVDIHLGVHVEEFKESNNTVTELVLSNARSIKSDLIIAGIGVLPNSFLAKECGLTLGVSDCIHVNEFQQTSDPDIYAVGDATEYTFRPTHEKVSIPLAGPANRAGRIAGEHAASNTAQYSQEVLGTSIVRVFNTGVACTGLSEKLCIKKGIKYSVCFISASHHASYFPGAKQLVIKLIYDPKDGKLLGGQCIGESGADKRIDVIASVIHFNGTVKDLATLDLAYAPPYGSAKDPLHQAACTALNDLESKPKLLHPSTNLSDYQVIDVRTESERNTLPLEASIHIPIDEPGLDSKIEKLDKDKPTVVTCHSGKRAHVVASQLCGLGFSEVYNLTGGMMIRSRK